MSDSRQAAFARECDLIMKGGITSGIVAAVFASLIR